ncbi:MAG: hypothetical protein AMXMBFR13_18130 [Phycisphaerae bacterium]
MEQSVKTSLRSERGVPFRGGIAKIRKGPAAVLRPALCTLEEACERTDQSSQAGSTGSSGPEMQSWNLPNSC